MSPVRTELKQNEDLKNKKKENSFKKKQSIEDRFECVQEEEYKNIFEDIDKAQIYMKKFETFLLRLYKKGQLSRIFEWKKLQYMSIHTDLRKSVIQILIYFMNFMGEDTVPSWLLPPVLKKKKCKVFLEMVEEAKHLVLNPTNTEMCGQKRKRVEDLEEETSTDEDIDLS